MAKTARKTESSILGTVHKSFAGLHRAGLVDKVTMREFGSLCLKPVEAMAPEEIKALREREQISQPAFARHLNVRESDLNKWEQGEKRPGGSALKLLTLVKLNGLQAIA